MIRLATNAGKRWWLGRPRLGIAGMLFVVALAVVSAVAFDETGCAQAAHTPVHDFCYSTRVSITSPISATLNGYGVRVIYNASNEIALDHIGPRAHDLRPVTTGLTEVEVQAQDMSSTQAPWWLRTGLIEGGSTVDYLFYTANEQARRNQGVFFTGSDVIEVPSHADFDLTDNFAIVAEVEMSDTAAQTGTIAGRWDADAGYRLHLVASSTPPELWVQAQVDSQAVSVQWADATSSTWRMEFEAPTLTLYKDGAIAISENTGLGAATATSTDLIIGESLTNATIRRVSVRENTVAGETVLAQWGFQPHQSTEESAADPIFTGWIADEIGSSPTSTSADLDLAASSTAAFGNHPARYTFNRLQSGIVVTTGAAALTSAPQVVELASDLAAVFGDPFESVDLFGTGAENTNLPFYSYFDTAADGLGLTRLVFWAGFLNIIGFIFLLFVTNWTGKVVYGIVAGATPLFLGITSNLIPAWILLVWLLLVLGVFAATRWERQAT